MHQLTEMDYVRHDFFLKRLMSGTRVVRGYSTMQVTGQRTEHKLDFFVFVLDRKVSYALPLLVIVKRKSTCTKL